jgi:TPR repeat protein
VLCILIYGLRKKYSLDLFVRGGDIRGMNKLLLPLVLLFVSLTCSGQTPSVADVIAGQQLLPEQLEQMQQVAEQGDPIASYALAEMYARGYGVAQDNAKAIKWWRMAAEQGYADAQYKLGSIYYSGNYVPKDVTEAVKWHCKAANQGNVEAQYTLGLLYFTGQGIPTDYVLSYMWFNLSAAQGNETAQGNLGLISEEMTKEQIAEAQKLSREWLAKRKK